MNCHWRLSVRDNSSSYVNSCAQTVMISRKARPRPGFKDSMENTACRTIMQNPDCTEITNSTETLLQKQPLVSSPCSLSAPRGTGAPCPGTASPPAWPRGLPGRGAGGQAVPASAAAAAPPLRCDWCGGHGRRGECGRRRGPPSAGRGRGSGPHGRRRLRG